MKKFLFLFVFSFVASVSQGQTMVGPQTPVPPIPDPSLLMLPPVPPVPPVIPQTGIVIDLPLLPAITLPAIPQIKLPALFNPPMQPIPDDIAYQPLILTKPYCDSLRTQIFQVESELMLHYMNFNTKRRTIESVNYDIDVVKQTIADLNYAMLLRAFKNEPIDYDLQNQLNNRISWKAWLYEKRNKLEDELIPIEAQIDYWEPILLDLKDKLSKAGC